VEQRAEAQDPHVAAEMALRSFGDSADEPRALPEAPEISDEELKNRAAGLVSGWEMAAGAHGQSCLRARLKKLSPRLKTALEQARQRLSGKGSSPELNLLDEKGLLAPVAPATLAQVPAKDNASDGDWLGVLARENVIDYDPALISSSAMPTSLLDLAGPAWKGKIGIAPSDADFLPLVSAMIKDYGADKTLAWLRGLKTNAKIYEDDEGVVAAVARGDVAAGIVNNYYWARLETELGPTKINSTLYHFKGGDIGGLINISGAAVLKSSRHQAAAQKFLAFLVSAPAQTSLGLSTVDYEYPLRPGVAPNKLLKAFAALQPPAISPAALGDDRDAGTLLQQAGLI